MSEIILVASKKNIFMSSDKTVVADLSVYDDAMLLTTKKGKYVLKQDGIAEFPSYSTFYSGGVDISGRLYEVQVEVMKRTAVLSW